MKFSLKKLFSRKGKKNEPEAAEPAAEATAATEIAPEPEPPAKPAPDPLARFKEPEGYYLLNLDVKIPGQAPDGQFLSMIRNDDTGFMLAMIGRQPLASVKTIATQIEDYLFKDLGFDVGHVYFKRKDANFFFDGYDELLGLPQGNGFQLVLVPEGSDWRPQFAPPPMRSLPGTSTILQHPATLLAQFQPAVQYPIIFLNGYDLRQPVLPQIPKPAEQQPAAENFNAVAIPAAIPPALPDAPKEEKPADQTATPAAASPPPPAPKM